MVNQLEKNNSHNQANRYQEIHRANGFPSDNGKYDILAGVWEANYNWYLV